MTQSRDARWAAGAIKLGAVLVAGGLVLSGCASAAPASEPTSDTPAAQVGGLDPQPLAERTTITVNTAARVESFSPLFLAFDKGEFEKENLDIQFTELAGADALPGLGQNQIQVIATPPSGAVFNAISEGIDMRAVMPCYLENEDRWWVRKEFADKGADALKGQAVANTTGPSGSSILGLDTYLQEEGVEVKEVTVERFPPADVPQALIQGAVAAAYVPEPGARIVEESGLAVAVDTMPKNGGSSQCTYLFGPDLLDERPEVGQAFIRAVARTMRDYLSGDYKSDPQTVKDLAAALKRTEDEIKATPSLTFDPEAAFDPGLYTRLQGLWMEIGGILSYEEPLEVSDMIDERFVDALQN
ncbi:ABC transporter substrate-binding protein [Microbacterium immunditiarum]|uniref:ABC-type nitrate/sulfonate/bicarbonate transport system substrate-binding protein n=1 Tax=Microbacterium immunditiarum TaxID=337480 RepID=A0A7Y9KLE0_9MICO|nr:ABC transporter substrate-binding protein [Microbacterium immunditiarum]NYE19644.1 ABC-type nitrate/sulfonate/bicarbonate transport system substrate-binding protein [Microbacterium immunditiarum]